MLIYGEVGKEGLYLSGSHVFGMPFVVEKDVTLDPTDVGLFGANRIMLETNGITYTIEQLLGTFFHFSPRELLIYGMFSGILSVNLIPYDCTRFRRVWQVSYTEMYPSKTTIGSLDGSASVQDAFWEIRRMSVRLLIVSADAARPR